jgi:predicted nucleotidyltransferase
MGTNTSIADALFSKTQQRVLALLYGHVERSFYLKEIIDWVDAGRGTVQREVEKLTSAGILTKRAIGNQQHYQANPSCQVYDELCGIVRKTFGLADVIGEALLPFDKQVAYTFIYGSIAKGEETASSDVDLFVVSESVAYSELMGVLTEAAEELGRTINPSIYSRQDIKKKISEGNAFLSRVMEQPKIWVKGSDDDIREFR